MKCYKCRAELSEGARYCSNCGANQGFSVEILERAIRGDQEAMAELYNGTYNDVYYTIRALIKDEDVVMDILQDSYIRGFQHLEQLNHVDSYRPWMKRIAVNTAKNWLIKKGREKNVLFSQLTEEENDQVFEFKDEREEVLPDVVIDREETSRLIGEIVDTLSEEQRMVVGMFYYEEMSVKEIAEILGCSENTVKSRLNYARKKIESQVLELEKRGTKLYALAPIPFMLLLFRSQRVQAAEIPDISSLQKIIRVCDKQISINRTIEQNRPAALHKTGGHSGIPEKAVHVASTGKKIGTGMKVMISMVLVTATAAGVIWGNVAAMNRKEAAQTEAVQESTAVTKEVTVEPTVEPPTEESVVASSATSDSTMEADRQKEHSEESMENDRQLIDYTAYKPVLESGEYDEYVLVDMNGDGTKELIVICDRDYEYSTVSYYAYALENGKPVYIGEIGSSNFLALRFVIGEDGYLYGIHGYMGDEVYRYTYEDGKIQCKAMEEMVIRKDLYSNDENTKWEPWLFEKEWSLGYFPSDDYRLLEYESTISEDKYKPGDDITLDDFDNIYYLDPYNPDGKHVSLTPHIQKDGVNLDLAVSIGEYILSGYYEDSIPKVEQHYNILYGITDRENEDSYILNPNGSVTYYSSESDNDRSGLTYFPYKKDSHKNIHLSDYNGYRGKALGADFEMSCTFQSDSENIYLDMKSVGEKETYVLNPSQAEIEGNTYKFYYMKAKSSGEYQEGLYVIKMIFEDDKIIIAFTFEGGYGGILQANNVLELT